MTKGNEGLGMTAPSRGTRAVIEHDLKEILLGADPLNIEGLWQEMFWRVRGVGRKGMAFQAISAVDIALWDLKARSLGLPLFKLLGPCRDSTPIYGSGGWTNYTDSELIDEQLGYVERGMHRVKMKVGKDFGTQPEADVRRVAAVRARLAIRSNSTSMPTTPTPPSRPSGWAAASRTRGLAGTRSRSWPMTSMG